MNETKIIRNAQLQDAERILEIYAYYVRHTAITFEYTVPTLAEFRGRMEHIMRRYPYLVLEKAGQILGYAYADAFQSRAAYGWACELTIYIDHAFKGRGAGRALYQTLERALREMGVLNLYACIAVPASEPEPYLDRNSAEFHAHLGFSLAGTFRQCGYKFDRWYNMIWMEKFIGEHHSDQPPVRPFREITGKVE